MSAQIRYPGDIEAAIDKIGAYRAAGATHLLVSFMPPTDPALPGQVGEALAQRLDTDIEWSRDRTMPRHSRRERVVGRTT